MNTAFRIGAAMMVWLGAATTTQAQEVEWKQTVNMPKGKHVPSGSGDILGIELGDSYPDVKAKLQALLPEGIGQTAPPKDMMDRVAAEMDGQSFAPPIKEERRVFRMQTPGASNVVTASFIAKITLTRDVKGSTQSAVSETIEVYLSAPSSGHQVIAIQRYVTYNAENDQPRAGELLASLKQKMRSEPQVFPSSSGATYRFQFNDAKPYAPAKPTVISCQTSLHALQNANQLKDVNATGDCDALLEVAVNFGISRDHIKSMIFTLSDNERLKANVGADYEFVSDYVRGVQDRTRGPQPKL